MKMLVILIVLLGVLSHGQTIEGDVVELKKSCFRVEEEGNYRVSGSTLEINGEGEMCNCNSGSSLQQIIKGSSVKTVRFGNSVKSVGRRCFS